MRSVFSGFLGRFLASSVVNLTVKSDLMYLFYWLSFSKIFLLPKVCFLQEDLVRCTA